jgi:hypothetical protein
VVVTRGPEEELPAEVAALAPPDTVVVMSSAAWSDYEVPGSPYVVHVDGPRGRVRGEGTGVEWPQVRRMLLQADGQPGPGVPPRPAPTPVASRRSTARCWRPASRPVTPACTAAPTS